MCHDGLRIRNFLNPSYNEPSVYTRAWHHQSVSRRSYGIKVSAEPIGHDQNEACHQWSTTLDVLFTPEKPYHQVVIHFLSSFWYMYFIGRISRIHHQGIVFSRSVIFCTASCLSFSTSGLFSPVEPDRYPCCPIVRGMCHRSNVSKSNRMWHSERTICSIIHRRGMLESACSALSRATPPPRSAHHQFTTQWKPEW